MSSAAQWRFSTATLEGPAGSSLVLVSMQHKNETKQKNTKGGVLVVKVTLTATLSHLDMILSLHTSRQQFRLNFCPHRNPFLFPALFFCTMSCHFHISIWMSPLKYQLSWEHFKSSQSVLMLNAFDHLNNLHNMQKTQNPVKTSRSIATRLVWKRNQCGTCAVLSLNRCRALAGVQVVAAPIRVRLPGGAGGGRRPR